MDDKYEIFRRGEMLGSLVRAADGTVVADGCCAGLDRSGWDGSDEALLTLLAAKGQGDITIEHPWNEKESKGRPFLSLEAK